MSGSPTRLAVQSQRRLVRDALCAYLADRPDFSVVGQTSRIESLYELCALRQPDIVVADVDALTVETVDALRPLLEKFPHTHLVVMYARLSPHAYGAAEQAGISTLVPCDRGLAGLVHELRRYADPRRRAVHDGLSLTERELEIVTLLGAGRSVPEIAQMLRISPHTVENHKRRVYVKLGVGNQIHAVSRATSLGLIPPPAAARARPDRNAEFGRSPLVVVGGTPGTCLDQVARVLIEIGLPVVRAGPPRLLGREHWAVWQRGPLVAVLVDPAPADWLFSEQLGAQAILVCAAEPELPDVVDALMRGVRGLLRSRDVRQHLPSVLNLVASGYFAMPAANVNELVNWLGIRLGERSAEVPVLTARERDILASIARGETVRQTARSLGIAAKTVENTQARLFRKLGVRNRSGALTIAHQLGLIDPGSTADD